MNALRRLYVRPSRVFICYRRDDASGVAGRLYDALGARWGAGHVRMDVHDIPPGAEFNRAALGQIAESDLVLVLIGPRWRPERLADPADYVRQEIETALETKVRLIPVLVNGAPIPGPDALPPELRPLRDRNAFELSNQRWSYDVQVLASHMERRSWPRAAVFALVLLALAGAYVLRGPIARLTQASDLPDPPADSTGRPGGTQPQAPVVEDTAPADRPDVDPPQVSEPEATPERSPRDSLPASPREAAPRSAASPPPAPSTEAEPRAHPAPAPTTGSVVERATLAVGPDRYRDYEVTITESRPCRLRGRVETLEGGSRDIDVLVLDGDAFERFRQSRRYTPTFQSRRTREIALDVPLPGPGEYRFVISNVFSAFTGKEVLVDGVRWECAGGGSDPSAPGGGVRG